jgi:hypothetical protein
MCTVTGFKPELDSNVIVIPLAMVRFLFGRVNPREVGRRFPFTYRFEVATLAQRLLGWDMER